MTRLPRFLLAGCAALALACGGGSSNPSEEAAPSGDQYTIIFDNPQFEDATIYIIFEGAGPRRLGRVTGTNTERWRVPARGNTFIIQAAFMALGEIETDAIFATPGDTITIRAQSSGVLTYSISR